MKRAPVGGLTVLLGGFALLWWAYSTNEVRWVLARAPIKLSPGVSVSQSFHADLSEACDIELEIDRESAASAGLSEAIIEQSRPADLDLTWTVTTDGETASQGGASEYLYVRLASPNPLARVAYWMLNLSEAKLKPGVAGRGIGRFPCEPGLSYVINGTVGEGWRHGRTAKADLVVRVNRTFAAHRQERSLPLLLAGAALSAIGAAWTVIVVVIGRLKLDAG